MHNGGIKGYRKVSNSRFRRAAKEVLVAGRRSLIHAGCQVSGCTSTRRDLSSEHRGIQYVGLGVLELLVL